MNKWIRMGAPDVAEEEAKAVYEQVLSGWISQGKELKNLKKELQNLLT